MEYSFLYYCVCVCVCFVGALPCKLKLHEKSARDPMNSKWNLNSKKKKNKIVRCFRVEYIKKKKKTRQNTLGRVMAFPDR